MLFLADAPAGSPLAESRICEVLEPKVATLDVRVALGTHVPLSADDLARHLGLEDPPYRASGPGGLSKTAVFNHHFDDPSELREIGRRSAEEKARIDPAAYAHREDEGVLLVPHAGEVLYKLGERGPPEPCRLRTE